MLLIVKQKWAIGEAEEILPFSKNKGNMLLTRENMKTEKEKAINDRLSKVEIKRVNSKILARKTYFI